MITAGDRAAPFEPPASVVEEPTDPAPELESATSPAPLGGRNELLTGKPWPAPARTIPPLMAEVEVELTREAPRVMPAERPPRRLLFGLAAVSLVALAVIATLLIAAALVATLYLNG